MKSKKKHQQSNAGENEGGLATHVYLNIYDLTPMNNYLYWFGFGIFHSGIEVHGMEYGFGAHEHATSGVFEVEPRNCPGFVFRRSVWLGTTDMSRSDFRLFLEHLAGKYHGDTYHLIMKNCNHFTDDVCAHLTGKPIPGWVNRLARIGSLCNCILPDNVQVTKVKHSPTHPVYCEDESDSLASSTGDRDEDDLNYHLLLSPCNDSMNPSDKPLVLAKDVM